MGLRADLRLASSHQWGILLQGLDRQDMEHLQGTFRPALERRRRMVTCRRAVCRPLDILVLVSRRQATLICHRHLDIRLSELLLLLDTHRLATLTCHRQASMGIRRLRIATETGGGRGIDDLLLGIGIASAGRPNGQGP